MFPRRVAGIKTVGLIEKKEKLSVKNYCFVRDFYVFFSGRFVNNTLRGKSPDGTRVFVRACACARG